jgi:superfamily I DNA/RNA helicase
MRNDYDFLNDLNDTQKFVCESDENFILTACPGSGKTRTITYRLAFLVSSYPESDLLNIAITYTNRAADEIENRLLEMDIDTKGIWSGTIHQFCMKYIIRPYSMYHSKLCKGYKVIDEYVKDKYVTEIAKNLGISGYINNFYDNDTVMSKYCEFIETRKEMDFDKILEYSLELVEQKEFVAFNISRLIRSIHIDEYQDTNEKQYQILSSIIKANVNINILFVGDVNQAIYRGLGGVAKTPKEIRELFPVTFTECCLDGCYRSTQRVVDYYVNYELESTDVSSVSQIKSEFGKICYEVNIDKDDLAINILEIIKQELEKGIPECEICVVAPQWYQIFPMANRLRELLPKCNFDAPNITPIKYDPLNVFFLIAKILFTQQSGHQYLRRKIADEIITIITDDYDFEMKGYVGKLDILKAINETPITEDNGIQTLRNAIVNVLAIMGVRLVDELAIIYDEFFEKIDKRIKEHGLDYNFGSIVKSFKNKTGIVINTIHGVKGEEFTTVIAFDLLNGHLPHWNYIFNSDMKPFRSEDTNKLLYVLCSRAKKNIFLFSETGRETKRGYALTATDELSKYCFDYDKIENNL